MRLTNPNGQIIAQHDGDLMTELEGDTLTWNENGQLTEGLSATLTFIYNWDGKLSKAYLDSNNIHLKYDPMGNRVWKNSTVNGERKYIVDIAGRLPVILMELDGDENIKKSYIYENSRIIAQRDGDYEDDRYFYVNDRLGSVRQVIDMSGSVKRNYTYSPFGQLLESGAASGAPSNPFMFTGQWFDDEISQYYLRARMYDPVLMRFTARDPVKGKFKDPLTLHKYLYCGNDPINKSDLSGEYFFGIAGALIGQAMLSQLRITDTEFHMSVWYESCSWAEMINAFQVNRAVEMDLVYQKIQGGFTRAGLKSIFHYVTPLMGTFGKATGFLTELGSDAATGELDPFIEGLIEGGDVTAEDVWIYFLGKAPATLY